MPTRSIEAPSITPHFTEEVGSGNIVVECKSGLAQIKLSNGTTIETLNYDCSLTGQKTHSMTIVPEDFDQSKPLRLEVLGCNGRMKRCSDAWKMAFRDAVCIPDSKIILRKQSAIGIDIRYMNGFQCANDDDEADVDLQGHKWAVMLQEKGVDGQLSRAKTIDLRIGAILDGAVVYYEDGHSTPCGLRFGQSGSAHYFGGHNSQKLDIPSGVDIVKVEVNRFGWGNKILGGITMTLANGTKAGSLNKHNLAGHMFLNNDISILEAGVGEKIVGFYGTSSHYTEEFGIITGPKDEELPAQTWDMAELRNMQSRDWALEM